MSFERRAEHDGFGGQMSMSPGQPHPNNVVREFLRSNSDASHLFFAKQVVPLLGETDVEIDRNITDLAQRLREDSEET